MTYVNTCIHIIMYRILNILFNNLPFLKKKHLYLTIHCVELPSWLNGKNLASIHEVVDLIPGSAQWVKDLELP